MGFTLEQANKMIETVRPAWPEVVTTAQIRLASAVSEFNAYLGDRRNSRKIPYRFEACGYTAVRNPQAKDGQWVIDGHRQAVYARVELSLQQRVIAVKKAVTGCAGVSEGGIDQIDEIDDGPHPYYFFPFFYLSRAISKLGFLIISLNMGKI